MRRYNRLASICLLSFVAGLVLAELAVRGLDLFTASRELTRAPADRTGGPEAAAPWALVHPYLGFSMRPGGRFQVQYLDYLERALPEGERVRREDHHRNVFGFRSPIRDYREVAASDFAVGVFGGSMAEHVAVLGGEALAARLGLLAPHLAGRVRVLNFATGAYKQPQPLLVLVQALLLDIPLDAVVEIDGYNELVFGARNASQRHHPLFPSRFHTDALVQLAGGDPSGDLALARMEIARCRRRAETWRRAASAPVLAASELARALLGALASRQLARAAEIEAALQDQPAAGPSLVASLPETCLETGDCSQLVVDLWARSSLAMARLAEGAGLPFLHVLQPNQYVPGSKPLSAEERALLDPSAPSSRAVRSGYPKLLERGRALREQGVAFVDATGLFRDVRHTRYVDACCHVDARGNREIARRVAEELAVLLARRPPPS